MANAHRHRIITSLLMVLEFTFLATNLSAQGILLPDSHDHAWRLPRPHPWPRPPIGIAPPVEPSLIYRTKKLEIDARIIDSVARVQWSQTFVNEGSQIAQVRVVMPLPYDVTLQNLTFLVDGQEIEGRLLPADEAGRIYQSYVQRSKDPALVQWIGTGLLQTSVFPIPPGKERTVSLSYSQVVRKTNGMLDWQMPLKAASYTSMAIEKVSINIYLQDSQSLGNIYSPTHTIETTRNGNQQANVKYISKGEVPASNFRLLVSTTASELAASWLSYRPDANGKGYFLMLLHPDLQVKPDDAPKDIVLVLDKSGSMRGDKIDQARQALTYVIDHMPKKDRLGLVVYDSQVLTFRDTLIDASNSELMSQARSYVQSLGATGSTNIDQALDVALKMVSKSDRNSYIVHLSDGIPTVGERDERRITANAVKLNTRRARIFNFGVGYDVNSKLMNRLSQSCFGQSFFVSPDENIEAPVSQLYDRLGQPAMSQVRWSFVGEHANEGKLESVYPAQLEDLFAGDEASVLGQFSGRGKGKLVITGKLADRELKFEQPIDLDQTNSRADGAYIASLWASRRAAAIIDEIDLEGRRESLIQELVELAKKYGILTEYTAFLAEEPAANLSLARARSMTEERLYRLSAESGKDAFSKRLSNSERGLSKNLAEADISQFKAAFELDSIAAGNSAFGGSAKGAPAPSAPMSHASRLQAPSKPKSTTIPVRRVGKQAFFLRNGQWVDSQLDGQIPTNAKKVERFSDEYFALLAKHKDLLQDLVENEEPIVVQLDGQVYIL